MAGAICILLIHLRLMFMPNAMSFLHYFPVSLHVPPPSTLVMLPFSTPCLKYLLIWYNFLYSYNQCIWWETLFPLFQTVLQCFVVLYSLVIIAISLKCSGKGRFQHSHRILQTLTLSDSTFSSLNKQMYTLAATHHSPFLPASGKH